MKKLFTFLIFLFGFTVFGQVFTHDTRVKLNTVNELTTVPITTEILVRDTSTKEMKYVEAQDLPQNTAMYFGDDAGLNDWTSSRTPIGLIRNRTTDGSFSFYDYGSSNWTFLLKSVNNVSAVSGNSGNIVLNSINIPYDNTASGLLAENVKAALDELEASIGSGGLNNVVEDTTPELGGDLEVGSNLITSIGNINLNIDRDNNQTDRTFIISRNSSSPLLTVYEYGNFIFGINDNFNTPIYLYGNSSDKGAQIQFYNGANEDSTVDFWNLEVDDDFKISSGLSTEAINIDSATLGVTLPSTSIADITTLGAKAVMTKEASDNAYIAKPTEGTNGQVLTTDGAGTYTWEDSSGGGSINIASESFTYSASTSFNFANAPDTIISVHVNRTPIFKNATDNEWEMTGTGIDVDGFSLISGDIIRVTYTY